MTNFETKMQNVWNRENRFLKTTEEVAQRTKYSRIHAAICRFNKSQFWRGVFDASRLISNFISDFEII